MKRRGDTDLSTSCCSVRKSLLARVPATGAERRAQRAGELAGRQRRSHDEIRARQIVALTRRDVHLVARSLLRATDAGRRRRRRRRGVSFAHPPLHVLADRILAGPQRVGEGLVDEHHRLLVGHVAGGEVAAGEQRNAHRGRVALGDDAHEGQRILAALVGDALRARAPGAIAAERQRVGDGRALDARRLPHAPQHVVDVRGALRGRRDAAVGIDADRRRARRLESHLHVEHADQAANQQAGADEQHAREGDLRDDERVAHPGAAAAFGRSAAGVLQRAGHHRPRRLQRRRHAEDEAGDEREDHGEAERGAVRPHVAQQRNAHRVELRSAGACRRRRGPAPAPRRCTTARAPR